MNLWPPRSEITEFLISSYRIVQQTSVKFCTLIKDDNRDIIIFFHLGLTIKVQSRPSLSKNEGFQLPTDLLFNDIRST